MTAPAVETPERPLAALSDPRRHPYRACHRSCPDRRPLGVRHCAICGCSRLEHGIRIHKARKGRLPPAVCHAR